MSLPVEFLSGADDDLQVAFNRFEDYREGFGVEFMMAVDANLARVCSLSRNSSTLHGEVRRQVMQRFPFGIFYEAFPKRILVTAILDLRQDPERIRTRLRS